MTGSATFKRQDASSYDPVAARYDALITRYSGPLVDRLLTLADIREGARVLDVGTGPGIVALSAASLVGERGHVTGVDLSDGMVDAACAKLPHHPAGARVEFRVMDAEQLALPDASFDVVVSLFALHHFPNPGVALAEMHRVLRPGGVLCIGVGSGPSRTTVAGVVDALVQLRDLALRKTGRLLRAPQFLADLVSDLCPAADSDELTELASVGWKDTSAVPRLVRGAGFVNVRTDWLGQRRVIDSIDEFWELQRIYSSTARKRLSAASPELTASVRAAFDAACRAVRHRGGVLVYSYASQYVLARRALPTERAS